MPELELINCDVCGKLGIRDKEIVLAEYYNPLFRHDSTRYECRDVFSCLDRAEARLMGKTLIGLYGEPKRKLF